MARVPWTVVGVVHMALIGPSAALAIASGRKNSFSVTTTSRPAGVYTVYFYAGGSVLASSGTVTCWR
jgi:hypothetical protein